VGGPERRRSERRHGEPHDPHPQRTDQLQRRPAVRRPGRIDQRRRPAPRDRQRRVRVDGQPDLRGSPRLQHPHEDRHLLRRLGHRESRGARRRPQLLRNAGARRILLGRDDREARAAHVQDHARRLHDMPAADAALAARRDVRRADAREARDADQRIDEGQGRPRVLHPGDVLPDQQGGSRDGIPHPGLRGFVDQRTDDLERVLLGDQSQPGCDVLQQLVLEDRLFTGITVPLRADQGFRQRRVRDRARARGGLHPARRIGQTRSRHRQLYPQWHDVAGAAGEPARDGARELFLEHHRGAALPAEHLRRDQPDAKLRRQRHRQLGREHAEWYARARRSVHQRNGLDRQRHAPAPQLQPGRAKAARHSHLRRPDE
jgi:hypothetical protein